MVAAQFGREIISVNQWFLFSEVAGPMRTAHVSRMLATLVMTVIGADRPGLVQMVASRVADHGGNWLESRMCRLGGQFAGILRVEVPVERRDDLVNALRTLEVDGLRVIIHAEGGTSAADVRQATGEKGSLATV